MTADSVTPTATYRVQLQPGFTFADAAAQVPYLAALGVSHLHLSPVLEAVPGSTHGYDVVDHGRVREELGGERGLRELSRTAREHGLGLILDLVPNHMAVPAPEHLNGPLWEVLRDGPSSRFASWFDIDWDALGGKVLLPVLGDPLPDVLDQLSVGPDKAAGDDAPAAGDAPAPGEGAAPGAGATRGGGAAPRNGAASGEKVLRYYDHTFPLRPGTEHLPIAELVEAQWYKLAYWRQARTELNYRRFFTISDLIAVRVEDPEVFAATHATILRLLADGVADGLRIDHPDGLADPAGYLRRLAEASSGRWTVVEKILQRDEPLPADWACAGTTGYDALDRIDGVFTDPAGAAELTAFHREFTGAPDDRGGAWEPTVRRAAYRVVTRDLAAEVSRLSRTAGRVRAAVPGASPYRPEELAEAIRELLVRVPVYRPYVLPGGPATAADAAMLDRAAREAREAAPELGGALDFVRDLALARVRPPAREGGTPEDAGEGGARGPDDAGDFAVRFAQVASALHAKSVEDAAFYRYTPLLPLCEVGRDPGHPATTAAEFHAFSGRLAREWPATGTVLSTHDTKRSADVRLRLAVLSELPDAWREWLGQRAARTAASGEPAAPDRQVEYTAFQTAVGLGFSTPRRLVPAVLKAVREAGLRTSWTEGDEAYEKAVADFVEAGPCGPQIYDVSGFVQRLEPYATANSLGAALLHLTMPGVPDVYQNTESPAFTLVDPDNRDPMTGPVGGTKHVGTPAKVERALAGTRPNGFQDAKLRLSATALRLRRDHPEWYGPAAAYDPLAADGPAADHCLAFLRGGGALTAVTRLSRRLEEAGGWRDTVLPLPPGRWHDRLGGASYEGRVPLAELLEHSPVALLTRE